MNGIINLNINLTYVLLIFITYMKILYNIIHLSTLMYLTIRIQGILYNNQL